MLRFWLWTVTFVALFKGRQVSKIIIFNNDGQIYNNNSTNKIYETLVSYFIL